MRLVVAPGLKKRGTSTGEDFEIVNTLLKIEVVCEGSDIDDESRSRGVESGGEPSLKSGWRAAWRGLGR